MDSKKNVWGFYSYFIFLLRLLTSMFKKTMVAEININIYLLVIKNGSTFTIFISDTQNV